MNSIFGVFADHLPPDKRSFDLFVARSRPKECNASGSRVSALTNRKEHTSKTTFSISGELAFRQRGKHHRFGTNVQLDGETKHRLRHRSVGGRRPVIH